MHFIRQIFELLDSQQRKTFIILQMMVVIMSLLEITTLVLIWQLISIIITPDISQMHFILQNVYSVLETDNTQDFINLFAIFMLFMMIINSSVSIFVNKKSILFAAQLGANISKRLYQSYLYQPWIFHTIQHSANLIAKMQGESYRTSNMVIVPIISINVKLILAIFLLITLFNINFSITLFLIIIFGLFYGFIYHFVHKILRKNGENISHYNKRRYHLVHTGLGGIKDILLLHRQVHFIELFDDAVDNITQSSVINDYLTQLPRYIVELLVLLALPIGILYAGYGSAFVNSILPLLSVYVIASLKLLPIFGQIYANISTIRSNAVSFHIVKNDLLGLHQPLCAMNDNQHQLTFKDNIKLQHIYFTYPAQPKPTLIDINLTIPKQKTIAFIGQSGSGKSTLIDILIGLLPVDSGQLLVDGQTIDKTNLAYWQSCIGYISQHIFLADASISENIAFGVKAENIDVEKINQCIKLAQLDEFISQITDGVDAIIGERGVRLSGGQRQRIGIARALYHDSQVLVMDEATNALDGLTEQAIIKTIDYFSCQKTIILIAHRFNTIKHCDMIYVMDKGKIVDFGNYEQLQNQSDYVKNIANLS